MAYYIEDRLNRPALGARRPMVNDYFLSTYTTSIYDGCEIGCPYCDGWSFSSRPFNETVRAALDLPQRVAEELLAAVAAPVDIAGNAFREQFEESQVW